MRYDVDALVTGAEAARLVGVTRHLVGMWKRAGKLTPKDRRGRSPLYRLGDVLQVERDTRRSRHSHRRLDPPRLDEYAA